MNATPIDGVLKRLNPLRWWHKRQALKWLLRYYAALGRRTEIERGKDSCLWRFAVVDEHLCEVAYRRHAEKAGLES